MADLFFIFGYPRARTAWLSVFLTTDRSLCLHEPALGTLADLETYTQWPYAHVGVADSGLTVLAEPLSTLYPEARSILVLRDRSDVQTSLARVLVSAGVPTSVRSLSILDQWDLSIQAIVRRQAPGCLIVTYDDLDSIDTVQMIHNHCLPGIPFDARRARGLMSMQIAVHPSYVVEQYHLRSAALRTLYAPVFQA